MRYRLVISTIAIVLVVLAALVWPVLLLVRSSAENELRARLDEQLSSITTELSGQLEAGAPLDLGRVDELINEGDGLRVVAADGQVLAERNADLSSPVSAERSGPGGTTIELLTSGAKLNQRFREQAVVFVVLAGGALLAAAVLAAVQARRLAQPLERLALNAARLGAGDFSATTPPSSRIAEIDNIAGALRASATRVDRLLAAERSFTADATHQLRTGLTGIALRLEMLERHPDADVRAEAEATIAQTHQLNATLDELLALVRGGSAGQRVEFDLVGLVDAHVDDWRQRFASLRRTIGVTTTDTRRVIGTPGLAGQVIDILIDNALRHGAGDVTVTVRGESVTVADQGAGISDERARWLFERPVDHGAAHGRGLLLARRLAEADGGRVELVTARPAVLRYTLVAAF
jgi:signal transduction histidine kinase